MPDTPALAAAIKRPIIAVWRWLIRNTPIPCPHTFESHAEFKRRCTRCCHEEWVMGNPCPGIGEPAYVWVHMFGGKKP